MDTVLIVFISCMGSLLLFCIYCSFQPPRVRRMYFESEDDQRPYVNRQHVQPQPITIDIHNFAMSLNSSTISESIYYSPSSSNSNHMNHFIIARL